MSDFRFPPPPRPQRPIRDPFEAWVAKQHALGHDINWLRHNFEGLRKRWETTQEDLPVLVLPRTKQHDRYSEI